MKISIIGSGTVGRNIGKALISNNDVIFYDPDKKIVENLKSNGYNATLDLKHALENSEISLIAVPTPNKDNKIDLSFIKEVSKDCGEQLKNKKGFHTFIFKSTIIPGTMENIIIPLIEEYSAKKNGKDFGVIFNPEFLTEISHTWTNDKEFEKTPFTEERIIIGEGLDKKAGDKIEQMFKQFNVPIFRTDYKTAEFIKYASNCCLLSKISYWNEIFLMCQKLGIDAQYVANIVAMDKRIGRYGSVLGKAAGGKCLEKDTLAFLDFIKNHHDSKLIQAAAGINIEMAKRYGKRE
jgi:nucleotide sugar dehydrogenase